MQLIVRQQFSDFCTALHFPLGDDTKEACGDLQAVIWDGNDGAEIQNLPPVSLSPRDSSSMVSPQARPGFDLNQIRCIPSCGNEGIVLLDRKYDSWER